MEELRGRMSGPECGRFGVRRPLWWGSSWESKVVRESIWWILAILAGQWEGLSMGGVWVVFKLTME